MLIAAGGFLAELAHLACDGMPDAGSLGLLLIAGHLLAVAVPLWAAADQFAGNTLPETIASPPGA
jgi:hypothetical protein